MIHVLGYCGLALNLTSMAMKKLLYLRWLSLIANVTYIFYGIQLQSPPFIIGCSIAVLIHFYHIRKIYQENALQRAYVKEKLERNP